MILLGLAILNHSVIKLYCSQYHTLLAIIELYCLLHYVLEGSNNKIINKLNIRLDKDTNTINKIKPKFLAVLWHSTFKDIYSSTHLTPSGNNLEIKHIILNFA